ncbi:MAG: nitrate ABC transporter, permease protein [Candidatus Manganitrophaceae bacterium]|nr:MAG: nitrate ABC transporter, permease protein [Candidatus Manganitrophaceae bacterium]
MEKVEMEVVFQAEETVRGSEEKPAGGPATAAEKRRVRPLRLDRLILPLLVFVMVLGLWQAISQSVAPMLPGPIQTVAKSWDLIREPFFDRGPNDKGLGWQLLYSLRRVAVGFSMAAAAGIPIGFLIGAVPAFHRALNPLIQILRPISPLAWLPIGLATFKAANPAAYFVIFITAIWPIILNTAFGVQKIPADYLSVARVLKLSPWRRFTKILLPATLPYTFTGLRISVGIAWLVIVAAEMLTGGIGIGFFVWDEWNNLSLEHIILAIFVIGIVGLILDEAMGRLGRRFDYEMR